MLQVFCTWKPESCFLFLKVGDFQLRQFHALRAKEMANHFYGFFGELEVQKGGMGGEFGW